MPGTAFSDDLSSLKPQQSTVGLHFPLDLHTGHVGLLKGEWVLLMTPWLSSQQISLWMESYLVGYCCQCTVVVAIGTSCSSTFSNSTIQGSSERLGKEGTCLISSICRTARQKAQPFWPLKHPLLSLCQGCIESLDQSQWGDFVTPSQ